MLASCSPIRAPRALELKDSPRSPQFIPASHMPKRQGNSLPFQDPILHIPQTNTHAASNSPNLSQLTLRGVCDPMRRNIVYELEHATRLPDVYEEEDAIWSIGRGTAKLPGTPYLSSRHSKVELPQGSPSTTVHNLNPPPLIRQRVAEYRRRNLVKKLKTPFNHEHGVWDDPPLDLEAVAQAQKRGSPPSKRERAGRLISGLLGRKEARDHRNTYQERGRGREASIDSYFVNDVVGIPIPHRTRSLEMRRELHHPYSSCSEYSLRASNQTGWNNSEARPVTAARPNECWAIWGVPFGGLGANNLPLLYPFRFGKLQPRTQSCLPPAHRTARQPS